MPREPCPYPDYGGEVREPTHHLQTARCSVCSRRPELVEDPLAPV